MYVMHLSIAGVLRSHTLNDAVVHGYGLGMFSLLRCLIQEFHTCGFLEISLLLLAKFEITASGFRYMQIHIMVFL